MIENAMSLTRACLVMMCLGTVSIAETAGSLDRSVVPLIGPVSGDEVLALAIQPDGKILLGGHEFSGSAGGGSEFGIVRLLPNGQEDLQFSAGLEAGAVINAIVVLRDGGILIGGDFQRIQGISRNGLALLHSDGRLDSGFEPKLTSAENLSQKIVVSSLSVDRTGRIAVLGFGILAGSFVRLFPDSSIDPAFRFPQIGSFNLGGFLPTVNRAIVQSDGKLVFGGYFNRVNGEEHQGIVRLNEDGSVDSGFVGNVNPGEFGIRSLVEDMEGGILVTGDIVSTNGIVRINSNGSIDKTFNSEGIPGREIDDIAVQGDRKILVAGSFTEIKGTFVQGIARLLRDGSVDPTFQSGLGANGPVRQVRVDHVSAHEN